jgi:hypothetical protein
MRLNLPEIGLKNTRRTDMHKLGERHVYIVTSGQYSDNHIIGVFSTLEKAKEYIAKIKVFDDEVNDCILQRAIDMYTPPEYIIAQYDIATNDINFSEFDDDFVLEYPYEYDGVVYFKIHYNSDVDVLKKVVHDTYAYWLYEKAYGES